MATRKPRRQGRPVTYWHGGAPGLREGGHILPRSVTGTSSYADIEPDYVAAADRVHITIDKAYAAFHASAYILPGGSDPGGGTLYAVAPEGRLEADPDDRPGLSFTVPRARIVRVAQTWVEMSPLEGHRAQRGHTRYVDGTEVYDPDGWQLAQSDRAHLSEMQHQLALENELLLLLENQWRSARGREPITRPSWLVRPADFDTYLQARMSGLGSPIRLV